MKTLVTLGKRLLRFFVVWFIDTISLLITAWILPGITIAPVGDVSQLVVATVAAFVLGIVNFLVRPLLLLITLPLGWMVVFAFGFFINGIVLWLAATLLPGFEVNGFWAAFFGGLFLSFVNTVISTVMAIDDEDSFYENLVQRQAARQAKDEDIEAGSGRGLVILETDGLSYQRILKAIDDGVMPTLKEMMESEGYQVSKVDCGLPPTTPACQAGILQGNNDNIPAFRWLEKSSGRMLEGGAAAAEVEPLLSDGNGLLRGGTSIGNMFSGDAAKSILTFSKILAGTPEDKKQRARDMYMLMRNPYFFTRVLVLFFGDVFLELWQGWQQRRQGIEPRLNRLHNGYPFLRAAVNVFLRDIGTYFTILDIIRGAPAMYTLYAGYDEVAHHSGPYSPDTNKTLKQFDQQVARLRRVIEEKAPRPYEILILSDHGQSFGATFEQRYGITILEFIEGQLPQGTSLSGGGGGDDGTIGVSAMMDELQNVQDQKQGGVVGNAMMNSTQRVVNSSLKNREGFQEQKPAEVTLAYGGNGAMVYFDLFPRKITLNELNSAFPGMVDKLVEHEGIGFVVAYEDDFTPVAFGKQGARNLKTGEVVGEDPLEPFGDVELRTWQLHRMANFKDSGDLILNSTIYPDGTVAALEELIGNHGGLGGEQTDAYLFHPDDLQVPATRGSFEFKAILDARRGLPGSAPKPEKPQEPKVNPWAPATLGRGLAQVHKWLGLAGHAITLDRAGYQEIARDAFMTGPALLIAFLAGAIVSFNREGYLDIKSILIRYGLWFVTVLFLTWAARLLRGKEKFTATLRVSGFAQSAHILELLSFIPVIGPIARFLSLLLTFFGIWIGTSIANELRGWRTILLPLIYLLTIVVALVFLMAIIEGTTVTMDSLLMDLGVAAE